MLANIYSEKLSADQINSYIKRLQELILFYSKPSKIILIGSASRAEMTTSSDIDVVVIFKTLEQLNTESKVILKNSHKLEIAVDYIFLDESDFQKKSFLGGICFEARTNGKIIYELDKAL